MGPFSKCDIIKKYIHTKCTSKTCKQCGTDSAPKMSLTWAGTLRISKISVAIMTSTFEPVQPLLIVKFLMPRALSRAFRSFCCGILDMITFSATTAGSSLAETDSKLRNFPACCADPVRDSARALAPRAAAAGRLSTDVDNTGGMVLSSSPKKQGLDASYATNLTSPMILKKTTNLCLSSTIKISNTNAKAARKAARKARQRGKRPGYKARNRKRGKQRGKRGSAESSAESAESARKHGSAAARNTAR